MIQTMGIIVACMAAMMFYPSGSTVNHFYDAYDTSNNQLVVDSGHTTSPAILNGAMCLTVAIPAVCLVLMTVVIQSVYTIGLR